MADTTKAAQAAEGAAALKVHHLRPAPGAKSAKIRVGRGEGGRRGKTAGRGLRRGWTRRRQRGLCPRPYGPPPRVFTGPKKPGGSPALLWSSKYLPRLRAAQVPRRGARRAPLAWVSGRRIPAS